MPHWSWRSLTVKQCTIQLPYFEAFLEVTFVLEGQWDPLLESQWDHLKRQLGYITCPPAVSARCLETYVLSHLAMSAGALTLARHLRTAAIKQVALADCEMPWLLAVSG